MPRLTRLTVRVRLSLGWIANIQMGKLVRISIGIICKCYLSKK